MIPSNRWKTLVITLLLAGVALTISACSGVQSMQVSKAKAAGDFDLVVQSYKNGQFMLNGAIISPLDLSAHFAYLRDQHRLPKTILLERSDEQKIHKQHLRDMATMAMKYGFTVYYDDDGNLRRVVPNPKNRVRLRGSPPPSQTGNSHAGAYDATHGAA